MVGSRRHGCVYTLVLAKDGQCAGAWSLAAPRRYGGHFPLEILHVQYTGLLVDLDRNIGRQILDIHDKRGARLYVRLLTNLDRT